MGEVDIATLTICMLMKVHFTRSGSSTICYTVLNVIRKTINQLEYFLNR